MAQAKPSGLCLFPHSFDGMYHYGELQMIGTRLEHIGELRTLKEAARLRGCSTNALTIAVKRKEIPHFRVGKSILVRLSDVDARYRPRGLKGL